MKLLEIFESFDVSEYYVIVFDVCSSSVILENLQEQNKLRVWKKFWEGVFKHITKISSSGVRSIVYKFVGDGFILLYRPAFEEDILAYCDKIKVYVNEKIDAIVAEYLDEAPARTGITIGIERGEIIRMHLLGSSEYMGEAINAASRLQSLLKLPEHSNKVLVSETVKSAIEAQIGERACKPVEVVLHNLYDNQSVWCYEIEL